MLLTCLVKTLVTVSHEVTSQESTPSLMTVICFSAVSPEKVNARFVADLCTKFCEERNTKQWKSALMFFRALEFKR